MNSISIKRGNTATLTPLEDGELAYLRDTGRLIINSNGTNMDIGVPTLAHSYTAPTHTLTGTMPQSGIVSAIFKPTADYNDGESISVNGTAYTLAKGSFEQDIPVQALFDIGAKTVTVGGSGGGGKMMQQLELPMSNVYEETSSEKQWDTMDVDGQPAMKASCTENGIIYAVVWENQTDGTGMRVVSYEQNYFTKEVIRTIYSGYIVTSGGIDLKAIRYKGSTYFAKMTLIPTSDRTSVILYKLNKETKTITEIKKIGNDRGTGTCWEHVFHVTEDIILRVSIENTSSTGNVYCFWYSFATNTASGIYSGLADIVDAMQGYSGLYQINKEQTKVRFICGANGIRTYIGEFNLLTKTFSNAGIFPIANQSIFTGMTTGAQIGDKLIYVSNGIFLAGKHTGEIDLFKPEINPLKYPDTPTGVNSNWRNVHLINDEVICQNVGKTYSLKLIPVPPENNPPVAYLYKGDTYNAPFIPTDKPINVLAIPSQSAFTITNMPQIVTEDKEIHMGQYDLQGSPTQLLIKKG